MRMIRERNVRDVWKGERRMTLQPLAAEGPRSPARTYLVGESATAPATRVVIVDDHQTLLDLLCLALSAEVDIDVVGTAATAAEGLSIVEDTTPDLVLMDFGLPDADGVATTTEMLSAHPSMRVVMLTATHDGALVSRAAAAGICGFVAKTGAFGDVLAAIRTARTGSMVIDPAVLASLIPAPRAVIDGTSDRPVAPLLTPREQEVLGLLGAGMDARSIARTLSISLHTCRGYVKTVLAKLDCHSQLEAVVAAGRLGLLPSMTLRP
jgi:DNA-binding NarL/FixJ family response regulator